MKIVLSAISALVLGTVMLTTSASAQPRCWWNGVTIVVTTMVGTTTDTGITTTIIGIVNQAWVGSRFG